MVADSHHFEQKLDPDPHSSKKHKFLLNRREGDLKNCRNKEREV
jgi:hypothetical protein